MQPPRATPNTASDSDSSKQPSDPSTEISVEIRTLIESVARKVARKGSTYELQLRLRDRNHNKLPFLHLDHPLAPFYQSRLIKARASERSASLTAMAANGINGLQSEYGPGSSPPGQSESGYGNVVQQDQDQPCLAYPQGDILTQLLASVHSTMSASQRASEPGLPTYSHYLDPSTNRSHVNVDDLNGNDTQTLERISGMPAQVCGTFAHVETPAAQEQFNPDVIVYNVNQEVHLLDSSGNEPSGLTTYIVVDNAEGRFCEEAHKCSAITTSEFSNKRQHDNSSGRVIYTIVPCTSTRFRTVHHRLLPVGYPLGAEVQQQENHAASIVIRRTVKNGKRFYDLRDEFFIEHKDVAEAELTPHTGGLFWFRTPSEM